MQKINFKNLPDTSTPLNASTLNQMQDNIESAIDTVASDIPTVVDSLDGDSTTDAPSVHAVNQKINTVTNYSTTETKIGTWIDGKDIYRCVLQLTSIPTTRPLNTSIDISSLNVDRPINIISHINKDNNFSYDIGNYNTATNDYNRTFYRKGTPDTIQIRVDTIATITEYYVIFEYTKNSD